MGRHSRGPTDATGRAVDAPLDASAIQVIIGVAPAVKGDVLKVTSAREATKHGVRFAGSIDLTTWAAFTDSDERTAIDGDFAMVANEVQPVRGAGVHVVALHHHMVGEEPATSSRAAGLGARRDGSARPWTSSRGDLGAGWWQEGDETCQDEHVY